MISAVSCGHVVFGEIVLASHVSMTNMLVMNNAAITKTRTKTLKLRLQAQREELAGCTTDAMRKCVREAIADTERQLAGA